MTTAISTTLPAYWVGWVRDHQRLTTALRQQPKYNTNHHRRPRWTRRAHRNTALVAKPQYALRPVFIVRRQARSTLPQDRHRNHCKSFSATLPLIPNIGDWAHSDTQRIVHPGPVSVASSDGATFVVRFRVEEPDGATAACVVRDRRAGRPRRPPPWQVLAASKANTSGAPWFQLYIDSVQRHPRPGRLQGGRRLVRAAAARRRPAPPSSWPYSSGTLNLYIDGALVTPSPPRRRRSRPATSSSATPPGVAAVRRQRPDRPRGLGGTAPRSTPPRSRPTTAPYHQLGEKSGRPVREDPQVAGLDWTTEGSVMVGVATMGPAWLLPGKSAAAPCARSPRPGWRRGRRPPRRARRDVLTAPTVNPGTAFRPSTPKVTRRRLVHARVRRLVVNDVTATVPVGSCSAPWNQASVTALGRSTDSIEVASATDAGALGIAWDRIARAAWPALRPRLAIDMVTAQTASLYTLALIAIGGRVPVGITTTRAGAVVFPTGASISTSRAGRSTPTPTRSTSARRELTAGRPRAASGTTTDAARRWRSLDAGPMTLQSAITSSATSLNRHLGSSPTCRPRAATTRSRSSRRRVFSSRRPWARSSPRDRQRHARPGLHHPRRPHAAGADPPSPVDDPGPLWGPRGRTPSAPTPRCRLLHRRRHLRPAAAAAAIVPPEPPRCASRPRRGPSRRGDVLPRSASIPRAYDTDSYALTSSNTSRLTATTSGLYTVLAQIALEPRTRPASALVDVRRTP